MKAVFSLASKIAPSVIFVDEVCLEALCVSRLLRSQAFMYFLDLMIAEKIMFRWIACWEDVRIQGNMKLCVR